eukprot:3619630-Pleurochrysis_carterae.AAC.1
MYWRCVAAPGVAGACAALCALETKKRAPPSARSTRVSSCSRHFAACAGASLPARCALSARGGCSAPGASTRPSRLARVAAVVPSIRRFLAAP